MKNSTDRKCGSRLLCLPLIAVAGCSLPLALKAADGMSSVEFNQDFLRSPVDVSMFSDGNPLAPGIYRIDLYTNEQWKGRSEVRFELADPDAKVARPCYDARLIEQLGLDLGQVAKDMHAALADGPQCVRLDDLLPQATANFDSGAQRLDVTASQAVLQRNARGYVDPEFWDDGVNAAMLQYDFNAYRSEMPDGRAYTSRYLGLRGGMNLGAWRLRYRGSAAWDNGNDLHYRNSAIYAERALPRWHSTLTVGESSTNGQVFDSISFRGIQVASDDRMYSDSQRGFAPVVRGIANSNARVRVTQRGVNIYETTVPPGPFVIDDLYPNGSGGDLLVTVTEANGSQHSFTVSYAATAELLRPGVTRYSLTAGEYRNPVIDDAPLLAIGSWRHGFSNALTGYAGGFAAEGYAAVSGGAAFNTKLGALAVDLTQASTRPGSGRSYNGQSVRVSYAKILPVIDTNVTLASYRYSSGGYYDPADAFVLRDRARRMGAGGAPEWLARRRSRFLVSATQTLPEGYGSFSISASTQNYWARKGSDTEYVASYNNQFGRFSVGLSASRTRNVFSGRADNQIMLSMSVPLGESRQAPRMDASYVGSEAQRSLKLGLSGSAGSNNQLLYNTFASVNDDRDAGRGNTAGGSVNWTAPYATLGANASTGQGYRQYGLHASGGLAVYRGGVVLTPMLGDTIGIIEARDARGARLASYPGIRVGGNGLAVVPYLNPYRRNSIEIDPMGISTDVQLQSTGQHVAPTAGAVALLRFGTSTGYSVLLNGRTPEGSPLPFAASVFDDQGRNVGYVAQGGQAIVRLPARQGTMHVKWGEASGQSCVIAYAFDPDAAKDALGYRTLDAICAADQKEPLQ